MRLIYPYGRVIFLSEEAIMAVLVRDYPSTCNFFVFHCMPKVQIEI